MNEKDHSTEGTILIVDDDEMIIELLETILVESGNYTILKALNGREALDVINQTEEIDLVLTDLKMPVMGGMELLAEIRRIRPDIPVVILTGYGRREHVIEALRLGASNFLLKPQEVEMVYAVVNKIIRVRQREKVELQIFNHFVESHQTYRIPNDHKLALPLIDLIMDR